jgi:chromosome partitioning protein
MIVIIGCNKGGAGKTTTATNLATGLAIRGKDVCLVDADPQRSAAKWHRDREANRVLPAIALVEKLENLSSTLLSLKKRFEYVIVDVAGRNSRELITGGAVADMIIAPHQASQLDLDTLEELEVQTVRLRDMNPKLLVYIYHAMASTNPTVRDTERAEFLAFIEDLRGFEALASIGYFRKAYRDVIPDGKSVLETQNEGASKEIQQLIEEVLL